MTNNNLYAIGGYNLYEHFDSYREKFFTDVRILNDDYQIFFVKHINFSKSVYTYLAWDEIKDLAEKYNKSWFSVSIGENYDDIDIQSFEAIEKNNEDIRLLEVFGIKTIITCDFS